MNMRSGSFRLAAISFFIIMAVWATACYHGYPRIGIDDANIFFSYAENFATGNGFVYNIGGERVEGFTSLLYVLMCALIFRIGLNEQYLLFFSVVLMIGAQFIVLLIINRVSRNRGKISWPYEALYMLLLLSSPSYITWTSITLMDTCMWSAVLTLGAFFVLYPPASISTTIAALITFSFMPLVRPEGMMVSPLLVILMGFRMLATGKTRILQKVLQYFLAFAGVVMLVTLFRIFYFGYPFPNTFYAKVSPSLVYNLQTGSKYLSKYLTSSPIVCFAVLIVSLWVIRRIAGILNGVLLLQPSNNRRPMLEFQSEELLSAIALIIILLPVITGGDHFRMFRFFQPAYPVLCLVMVLSAQRVEVLESLFGARGRQRRFAVFIPAAFLTTFFLYWLYMYAHDIGWNVIRKKSPIGNEFDIAMTGFESGKRLNKLFLKQNPLPSLGVIIAGGIKRTYPGEVIDLMGLNNTLIAHNNGDRKGKKNHSAFEYTNFYTLMPDVVLSSPPESPKATGGADIWLKGIFRDARFQNKYSYGIVLSKSPGNRDGLKSFFHKEFLKKIVQTGNWVYIEDENWSKNWIQPALVSQGAAAVRRN